MGKSDNEVTIIRKILRRDKVRQETFKKVGFVKDNLITTLDFNLKSTIERGIEMNSIKSVKLILNYIFKKINSQDYNDVIMMDLPKILGQKKLQINEFFDRSYAELQDKGNTNFCNMEQPLRNPNLPVFCDSPMDYFCIDEFKTLHNQEKEITNMIIDKDLKKDNVEKNIEVEHMAINFEMLIIAEKLRALDQGLSTDKLLFNDLFYACLLIDQEETNQEFYQKETVQKMIDFLYQKTRIFLSVQLYLYLIGYCLPFLMMIGYDFSAKYIQILGSICLFTQVLFFI